MDPQIRNFKDFLQLYNKITELCFKSCVDNLFTRSISSAEGDCVDRCVNKFAYVNQRMMGVYVEVQTAINTRRMTELEEQAKEAAIKAQEQAQPQLPVLVESETRSPEILSRSR